MKALVTGATRGIGAALLVEGEARGHSMRGTGRDPSGALPLLEVTDPNAQARFAAETGPLDLLVCNAGVFLDRSMDLRTLTAEALRKTFDVNVTGVLLTVQAQRANLSEGGRIAVIASQMGQSGQVAGAAFAYRASKAAAINLSLSLAEALRPSGIAVGVYHPGWVRTDMGGASAAISPEASARGLWDRFEALSLDATGSFESWDGRRLVP